MIQLVGPGGAGKTTAGRALAARLRIAFVDLDEQFGARAGDISAYLSAHGYHAYAAQNIQTYLDMRSALPDQTVIALSSGFMTYPDDSHPLYRDLQRDIVASPLTIALLPSFDYETCVAETVRRQLTRPFSRSAQREEEVIRARFAVYRWLPVRQCETLRPVDRVVDDLIATVSPTRSALFPSTAF